MYDLPIFLKCLNNGSCAYLSDKLHRAVLEFELYGKCEDRVAKLFDLPDEWNAWADEYDLSEIERARTFGLGMAGQSYPAANLPGLDRLLEDFSAGEKTIHDLFVRTNPRGWRPVNLSSGTDFERAFSNLKCKPFKMVEQWSFLKMMMKGAAYNTARKRVKTNHKLLF